MTGFVKFMASDTELLTEFLQLKFDTFVREFRWPLPCSQCEGIVDIDTYDRDSFFYGCLVHSALVGGCRCSLAANAFPYEDLFMPYVEKCNKDVSNYAILTSYMFRKAYRGEVMTKTDSRTNTTYAETLFHFIRDDLRNEGIHTILLSAGIGGSEKAFMRYGFRAISSPVCLRGSPVLVQNYAYEVF